MSTSFTMQLPLTPIFVEINPNFQTTFLEYLSVYDIFGELVLIELLFELGNFSTHTLIGIQGMLSESLD